MAARARSANRPTRASRAVAALAPALVLLVAGCAARRPAVAPTASGAGDGVTAALLDTLAVRLADAEVRRLTARVLMTDDAPEVRETGAQLAALRAQLHEVAPSARAEHTVTRRVLRILDARAAGLAVERRQLLVRFAPWEPGVKRTAAEEQLVAQRRAELRASLAADSDAGGGR